MGCLLSKPGPASTDALLIASTQMGLEKPWDIVLKVITLGDSGVGKTQLIRALAEEPWDDGAVATVGADFAVIEISNRIDITKLKSNGYTKHLCLDESLNRSVKLCIHDTAGQERYRVITRSYYRDADIVLLCFRLGDESSLEQLQLWHEDVIAGCRKPNVKLLVLGLQEDRLQDVHTPHKGPFNSGVLAQYPYYHVSSKQPASLEALIEHFHIVCRAEVRQNEMKNSLNLANSA